MMDKLLHKQINKRILIHLVIAEYRMYWKQKRFFQGRKHSIHGLSQDTLSLDIGMVNSCPKVARSLGNIFLYYRSESLTSRACDG